MERGDSGSTEHLGAVEAMLRAASLEPPKDGAAERPVLGRDPLSDDMSFDPFVDGLANLGRNAVVPAPAPRPLKARISKRRWTSTPPLSEIDAPDPSGLLERWLGPDERRRVSALQHLVEGDVAYDRFGMSPEVVRRSFPLFYALYRLYFRVRSHGHENLPVRGPVVVASNHGGLLPFDGAMLVLDMLLNTDPPRLARSIVDRWAGELPWLGVFYARVGQIVGTRENFADLLGDGQPVLVFPEGASGIRKTIRQRGRLLKFHSGFVEEALKSSSPIVPAAVVGAEDQAPILWNFPGLARKLGLPALPVTPTFPWLGPLGLLPYPVRYRIVYGEPLAFHDRFGPEDAEDAHLVRDLASQVRRKIQHLLDLEL
jgi:1-acyl-sn-glycerol-3-phosphate acyltransferase